MYHRSTRLMAAILACAPLPALAAGAAHPDHGFYVGAGASLNAVKFGQQDIFAIGTSDTYSGSTLVATGKAAGPATLYPDSQTGAGLNAQLGYFKAFTGSEWLWGGKLNYAWLNSSTSLPDALLLPTMPGLDVHWGLGVGIVAAIAFDDERDLHLRAIDARHLFAANMTRLAIRRGSFLRGYMYDFIEMFAPHLTRSVVDGALSGNREEAA